jgi:hypothetical protein
MPMSQKQSAEYNELIVQQGNLARSMKYAATIGKPLDLTDEQEEAQRGRAVRLVELATIAGYYDDPEAEVNRRIAAWMQYNQLSLTTQGVAQLIESKQRPDCGIHSGVVVSIGDVRSGGYYYTVMADDLTWPHQLEIKIPESVAEHFRQQGRRALQSEMRGLLNVARA